MKIPTPAVSLFLAAALSFAGLAAQAESPAVAAAHTITVYKSPTCGCCSKWVDHLTAAGFDVDAIDVRDLNAVKRAHGVPRHLASCHTAVVGGYVIEGHVPAGTIARLLTERPDAKGLAVPGMPIGSPGMEQGSHIEPYAVLRFDERGENTVYERHP